MYWEIHDGSGNPTPLNLEYACIKPSRIMMHGCALSPNLYKFTTKKKKTKKDEQKKENEFWYSENRTEGRDMSDLGHIRASEL